MTKPTAPKRWIDQKCSEHAPAETRKWLKDSWEKSVLPEFKKFNAAIADASTDVPQEFFTTTGIGHGNKNPLFLFLRPTKFLYITAALAGSRQDSLAKILRAYIQEWDGCMTALRNRFPDSQAVSTCFHALQRLSERTSSVCDIDAERLNQDWYDEYKDLYLRACDAFGDIQVHAAGSRQAIAAVKEALKQASAAKPKRKKRELSPAQQADNADTAVIVRQIRLRADGKPGQRRMSVMDALKSLRSNPTYGPIINRLRNTDSTWKKYVANSRKRSREISRSRG